MSETPTLYEWAGGREGIERMTGCFYDRVERDDLLSPLFPGGVSAAHREHVTTWWCEVFGGPAGYTERLGGYPAMLAHHRDLGITADQRFRFASLMSLAADDAASTTTRRLACSGSAWTAGTSSALSRRCPWTPVTVRAEAAWLAGGPIPLYLFHERPHACADLIPYRPDLLDDEPGRVGEVPIQVALPRKDRARVAAAHRDHDVRRLHFPGRQRLGELRGDIQADLGHGLDDGGVQLAGRLGAGRGHPDPPARLLGQQGGGHLGAAGVVGADEQHLGDISHQMPFHGPAREPACLLLAA
jgi:hemoglobin